MRRLAVGIAALLVASCALPPPPDTAHVYAAQFGTNADVDMYSANLAQWYFADPRRADRSPADALRSVAALDYLAGQLSSSPRWDFISPLTRQLLLNARQEVRQRVGVVPGARSQTVVDSLLAAANALAADRRIQGVATPAGTEAAVQALDVPVFTQSGAATLANVVGLHYSQDVNFATQSAALQMQNMFECLSCF